MRGRKLRQRLEAAEEEIVRLRRIMQAHIMDLNMHGHVDMWKTDPETGAKYQ